MSLRLAVIVSHPIQHFAPWHRETAQRGEIDLRVFFCCDWGVRAYHDPEFGRTLEWDVPLTEGYAHEFLPIARRPRELGFFQVDNPALARRLDAYDPDVIKIFGYSYRSNWRAVAWARRRRRPVLIYSDSNLAAPKPPWKRAAKEVLVRSFYRRVDGALYVGDNNRAYHQHFGLPPERLFPGVLPIDRERLLASTPDVAASRRSVRERHGIPSDAFTVLFCGKYTPRKRALDLAAACAETVRSGAPVWALLVGEGPERARLEAYLREQRAANVVLTGFVNQAAIGAYFAACDALAVPSDADPHPLVVTEAAAFGLPVVASDALGCIGPNDTVRNGHNALVHRCGDRTELRAALERLRDDPALRARLGAASAALAKQQDIGVAAQQLAAATQALHRLGPRS